MSNDKLHSENYDDDTPLYSEDGVDLTLIRWMLSMSPKERLEVLRQNVQAVMRLRNAKKNN
ncbi:hypothetical protein DENIS_4359 [Desulfonema ishimotonii]|uniref:Uncharacterized protein n=1 Tax=Desulfonema ishimotonii TaxID=45657 RepID=A0A401G2L8_9BACT|nr:hypothetical protein DENIS_4359 [Desulfonema ishimotonii]